MKNLRTKLFAAVSMLMVSALMLTTASFAWFTISTAPEVSNIKTTLAANNNLEIMLDNSYTATTDESEGSADAAARTIGVGDAAAGGAGVTNKVRNVYWGNLVDLKDYDQFNSTVMLQPAVWQEKNNGKDPGVMPLSFAKDGRIEGTETIATAYTGDVGVVRLYKEVVTEDKNTASTGDDVKANVFYGYRIDLWMRTNTAGNVSLAVPTVRGDSESQLGLGSWIDNKFLEVYVQVEDGNPVQMTEGSADTNGKIALTSGTILSFGGAGNYSLNTAVPVHVYVFYNAAELTNADLAKNGANSYAQLGNINLQFKHSAVTAGGAYQVTETSDYGRAN